MSTCSRFLALCAAFALAVGLLNSQAADETSARTKIIALEQAWNQAETVKDIRALDALMDDSFIYVDFDGTLMRKAQFLAHVKAEPSQLVVTESMMVVTYDKMAIVVGSYRAKELKTRNSLTHYGRFIDTWVYRDSIWVCVAAQATPVVR